ncbi:MAG: hypothetical protein INF92_10825 [Rhodobacter sp.]|jgi:hypothetical protein|nr:hypothetical protein [Rhodobacter sp.]
MTVPRQHPSGQNSALSNGGFLAHRKPKESEYEPKSSASPTWVLAEKLVRDIRRSTGKHHFAEDKIRSVMEGLDCKKVIEIT